MKGYQSISLFTNTTKTEKNNFNIIFFFREVSLPKYEKHETIFFPHIELYKI